MRNDGDNGIIYVRGEKDGGVMDEGNTETSVS